jgi:hypothetical protein
MFRQQKEEQIRELQIDSFIGSVLLTSSGGHPSTNDKTSAFETQKQALEERLKADVALEPSQKK